MKAKILGFLAMAIMAAPLAANAVVVTQLIHFDDATNGWKWYSTADRDFLFDPTNLQSSSLCADSTSGGNGSCVIEGTQGVLPKMTRPTNGTVLQGSANKNPYETGGPGAAQTFTLDAFYFLLTGKGTAAENAITVTGSNNASYTFSLGGVYGGNPAVTFYGGVNAGNPAGALAFNVGYVATFSNLFANVEWIQFSAPTSAQVRLDCVVATFDGTTTEPLSGFKAGCGSGGRPGDRPLPEPGTLALLGLGLLGLGAVGRRRS